MNYSLLTGNISNGSDPQKLRTAGKTLSEEHKIYPWVCGRCSREFVYSNLRELTVHHINHDHTNNPEDGSNWELLCLFCHDHEHSKYTEADRMAPPLSRVRMRKDVGVAHVNPFADLKAMMDNKK
ncbi:YajD family HNH nuclease [Enterobacter hormaechei]